MKKNGNVQIH
jgi:hypothetical protein